MKNFQRSVTLVNGPKDGKPDISDILFPPYGDIIHDNRLYYTTLGELYMDLKSSSIDEISKSYAQDPINLIEAGKKVDIPAVLRHLKYMLRTFLTLLKGVHSIKAKQVVDPGLPFEAQIEALENQNKDMKIEMQKMKLLLETNHLKIKDLEAKNQDLIKHQKDMMTVLLNQNIIEQENEALVDGFRAQLRNLNDELRKYKELNIIHNRPTTQRSLKTRDSARPIGHMASVTFEEAVQASARNSNMSSTMGADMFRSMSKELEKDKLLNLQKKTELTELRRKNDVEREKDLTDKQKETLIARLKIQVDERTKDLDRLQYDYDKVYTELKRMKEKEADRERMEWNKEVLSDKNPNMVQYYKEKIEEAKGHHDTLKKQLRKYALNEKKVFIKEKAFEIERAEYRDRLNYLQDRVVKLTRANDDIMKDKNISRGLFDKMLAKNREASDPVDEPVGSPKIDSTYRSSKSVLKRAPSNQKGLGTKYISNKTADMQ